jgi:hypothetical protein
MPMIFGSFGDTCKLAENELFHSAIAADFIRSKFELLKIANNRSCKNIVGSKFAPTIPQQ